MADLENTPALKQWLAGEDEPHSLQKGGEVVYLDQLILLQPDHRRCELSNVQVVVTPGNEMRVLVGSDLTSKLEAQREDDVDWLCHATREERGIELAKALDERFRDTVEGAPSLRPEVRLQLQNLMYRTCARAWRAKFDLDTPAHLPPMKIQLIHGTKPRGVRRSYRWTRAQHEFLRKHLDRLVNTGIISPIETEWVCPVVLVVKKDGTWRLCVDPQTLNTQTIPMTWEIPRVREELQERLHGSQWFSKFDFVAFFWQLTLHKDSRHLFSFFVGSHGSYCFNRVTMGARNSSVYTQKMVSRMFEHVTYKGKPLLRNGLEVLCDDVLMHAKTQEEMMDLIHIFMRTCLMHNLAIHPDKCELFKRELIYCGIRISVKGITVDPKRVSAILALPQPKTVGDVWKFKASVGWIRRDMPLLSESEVVLNRFVQKALKSAK